MDVSQHIWFGDKKTYLLAAIDDTTNNVVRLYFDTEETLKGYYNVLHQRLINHGIPYSFLTDRRTIFEYKLKNPSLEADTMIYCQTYITLNGPLSILHMFLMTL